jgi:hypothetical protein
MFAGKRYESNTFDNTIVREDYFATTQHLISLLTDMGKGYVMLIRENLRDKMQ